MKRRILSIITALALCLSLCPTWALAAEADPSLCKHHPEHTEDCGYTAPTEGHDCGHEHTAECYTLGVLPDADSGDPYEVGADTENLLDCHHSHNSGCGYVQADPGQPCGYVCRICPIEALIAALPEQVTEDNADDVRAQLDHILDLYRELDEGEQEEIDLSRIYALQGALDAANAPMTADGSTEQQDTDEASVEINGVTTYYATLEEAFAAANRQTATITMLNDAECVHSGSAGSPLNINGGNVTLNLNGKTLSGKGYGNYGIINVSGGSLLVEGEGNISVPDGAIGLSCYSGGTLTVAAVNIVSGSDSSTAYAGVGNEGGTVVLNGTQITGGASNGQIYQYSGTTTINNVTATGTTETCPKSVCYYNEGTLTINGGTFDKITVDSGNYGGVTSVAELLGEGCAYKKQDDTWATADEMAGLEISNVTVAKIPLTIHPQGDTSWYYSTQQTHTLAMNAAPVDSGNSVSYVWKNGTEMLDCTSDAYTVPAGTPVGSYTYTCEATCDGYTLSHTFTFEIKQSGTQFVGDGVVKTFNGSEETTSFSAGDTITVKATPTATGKAPDNSAMFAASFTAPTAGQMAVFVGDTQVSAPVGAVDGSYTMEVSAADVLLAAGGPGTEIPLTARFTANDNMADGAGTATVNITAAAKAEKDGKVIGYYGESNLDDAFTNDSATVTLLANVERTNTLTIKVNCTLDLGGHNITFTGTEYVWVQGPVTAMTIRGEGEIISEQSHALVVIGSVTLEGGTFTSNGGNSAGVYVNSAGASLSVTGEYVTIRNTGGGYGLAVNLVQSVQLSAGTYKGEKAVSIVSGTTTLGDLLNQEGASRVAYYKDNTTLVTEGLDGKELTGTVTVKACTHTGEGVCTYTHNENTSTHTKTCLACGYTETGDCGFEKTADPTADSHTGQCPDCKRDRSGAHSFSDWAGNPVARTCTVCGYEQTAAARVEKDSTTTYVGALADAFTDGNSGATVTLLSEVDLGSNYIGIRGSSTFTLDLNGQTVKASYYDAFDISGGSLTIQDSGSGGKIESSNITIEVTGGTLSIKSGTVSGDYGVKISSGTVNISGGTISGNYAGLWVYGGGSTTLSGGTFSGREGVLVEGNASATLKDMLAAGYAYHQNNIPVAKAKAWVDNDNIGEVPLDTKPAWLTGTVTVKECNHTGGLVPSENGYQHGGPCKCCGTELTAANHTLGADNQCSGCGAALAAKVEKSGSDTIYVEASNLASAFAAENTGATVTLLKDVDLGKNDLTLLSGTFTLDCGAFTLSSSSEYFVIKLDNANLTFAGGTIQYNGTGNAVYCTTGAFTMTGGTLNAASDYALNCEYGGKANIQGGTVGTQGKGLCIGNPNSVKLSGGTYATICIVSNYGAQKVPLSTILADGRAAYGPDGPITRDTVDAELTGPIIVKECEHDGVTVQDQGNGKHGLDCPYCGYHYEHTTALTATASGNNVTLNGGCGTEGCNYAAELGTVSFTFENLVYGNPDAKVSWIKGGPTALGVMLKIDNALNYVVQSEEATHSCSLTNPNAEAGTPVTAKPHTMKVSFYDDGSIIGTKTVECELTFTVAPAPLTPSITGTATKPYDGTTDAPAGLAITLTGVVGSDDVTATASYAYDTANAGTNKTITASGITLEGDGKDNYTLSSTTASAQVGTITKADQAAPHPPTAADANIKDTSITLDTIANAEYSMDGTTWQASPAFTGLNPNQTYTFYARLKEDGNHNASPSSTASITTRKMMLGNATVTVSGSYTYTGAAQTPAVAVVKNGKTLTAGTDYTVSYANNTNAGTATVTITGMGDYEGTNSTTFTIQRKTLTVAGAIAAGRPYNGTNTVTITGVTLDGVVNGDTVSVSTADLTGTLNGSNVGSYTAVTLPALTLTGEKADNYTLTRPAGAVSTSVTISKAAARTPKTGDLAVANKQAHTYTFGLGALRPDLPAGMSFGSSAVTYTLGAVSLGSYYGGSGAKIEGQTLTLPIQAVESNEAEGIGTITVTIHTGNFEDMTATINVRSVNKTIPTGAPTLSAATLTYGQPLSTITLRGDMAAGATPVPGKFEWSSPDNRPAVQEAYAAAWAFTPTDNNTYAIVNGTSTIKVVPASVAGSVVTLSPTSFRYDGQTHSPTVTSVKLGDTTLTADTDYTVEIPAGTAAGTYTVTITGKGNYTGTAAATFTINPVETGDEFGDESGTTLRLEVETGLSTVPEALKNNAKYDTPAKIEAELRTQVEQVMSNVGENIAVFDVTLQYKDASGTWHNVDPDHFPTEGVTAILPYPAGTGATGYTFTVQHLISSGTQAGTMETLSYTLTADGLQCKFLTLSPVAIGYQAAAKPVDPVHPNPGGGSGGGGGGVSTYAVTVEKAEHGKVTSNRTNASNGSTVTLTVTPEDGYVLDTLTVTDSRGNAIKLTTQGNGKYTFTMPGRAVTVKTAFAPLPDGTACDGGEGCPSRGFTDLGSVGTWYHEAVDYVLRNNLMGGYGNGLFGPNDTLTRAQFAQILYNKEGRPTVTGDGIFTDVAPGVWCAPAITWAAERGIVGGYGNGMFGPNDNITREQLAVMLWRYAGSPAATDKELHFNDAGKASGYALDALRWAVENGIINGKGGGILDPKGLATRAQTAQMLKNFLGK